MKLAAHPMISPNTLHLRRFCARAAMHISPRRRLLFILNHVSLSCMFSPQITSDLLIHFQGAKIFQSILGQLGILDLFKSIFFSLVEKVLKVIGEICVWFKFSTSLLPTDMAAIAGDVSERMDVRAEFHYSIDWFPRDKIKKINNVLIIQAYYLSKFRAIKRFKKTFE